MKIRGGLSGLFEKCSKFLGALSSQETHVLIRPSMQQRLPFSNLLERFLGMPVAQSGEERMPSSRYSVLTGIRS